MTEVMLPEVNDAGIPLISPSTNADGQQIPTVGLAQYASLVRDYGRFENYRELLRMTANLEIAPGIGD